MTEMEFDRNLYDQLTIVERVELALDRGGAEGAQKEIDIIKKEIKRKLYQDI